MGVRGFGGGGVMESSMRPDTVYSLSGKCGREPWALPNCPRLGQSLRGGGIRLSNGPNDWCETNEPAGIEVD